MRETIHDYSKRLEAAINKIKHSNITEKNKQFILRFRDECFTNGMSKARIAKYMYYLGMLAKWLGKDFDQAKKEDIKRLVARIEASDYVPYTKAELKIYIKKLYKWLEDSEEYPEIVRWLKPRAGQSNNKVKMPEEILTQEEIKRMIDHARNPRNRAFISVLYESGCRIGEILFIRMKHIEFDKYGALVRVDGKTGPRRVRLITSVPFLKEALNYHPHKDEPDAYVWVSQKGDVLRYTTVRSMLQQTAKRAKVKKKVNPHSFRHARATHLANHLTDAQMKEYFGWVQGSDMASVYIHLSGRDVDNALLTKVYGIEKPRGEEKDGFSPLQCSRCGQNNPPTFKFCGLCGAPLSEEAAIEVIQRENERTRMDRLMERLMEDQEFRDFMTMKIRRLSTQPIDLLSPPAPSEASFAHRLRKAQ